MHACAMSIYEQDDELDLTDLDEDDELEVELEAPGEDE